MKSKDAQSIEAKLPISESVRKRNPHLYPNAQSESFPGVTTLNVKVPVPPKPKRIRQSSKPLMNKLESEYFELLKYSQTANTIHCQSFRVMLGNGIWYKPDFLVFDSFKGTISAYEVKGPHAFRGGFEALKIAAHKYPEITFFLVWKENGVWQEQEVLP